MPKEDLYFITDEYLIPYLEFIKQNMKVYKAIKNNPIIFNASNTFKSMYTTTISPILEKYNVPIEERKFIIYFYIQGISAVIMEWIRNECTYPVENVGNLIKRLITGKDNTYEL